MSDATTARLSDTLRARGIDGVITPAYPRHALSEGVVHLGIGAFHRAHQAPVFDDAAANGDLRWGVIGVSLRAGEVHDALAPQQGLYTQVVRDGTQHTARIIGSVTRVLVAPRDPAAVIAALAHPDVRLVTLTITEKGYGLDRRTGLPDRTLDDMAHDYASLDTPRTAVGYLVAGLAQRRVAQRAPLTIMSCDNLPSNGAMLARAVDDVARAHDPALADWIAAHCRFPATMVDRIVPATTDDDRARFAARYGYRDEGLVLTEPFTQWVVQDDFAGPMPDLAAYGAQLVSDVAPWETAKLRMLNGAHSMIAYLGALGCIEHVHTFVADPARRLLVQQLWDEVAPTLSPTPGLALDAYRTQLLARFANAALQHRTRQIAMDGSLKLPQRLVAPLLIRAERGLASPTLSLAVAAWMAWQAGRNASGIAHTVDDPIAARTAAAWASASDARDACRRLLALDAIFPAELAANQDAANAIAAALLTLT